MRLSIGICHEDREGWEDVEDVFGGANTCARSVCQGGEFEVWGAAMSRLRDLLHELADNVADKLELLSGDARYYDQHNSPLPPATHCKLVRCGKIPGYKRGGRILVEREAMHRYIEAARVDPAVMRDEPDDATSATVERAPVRKAEDSIEAALERAGLRKAG